MLRRNRGRLPANLWPAQPEPGLALLQMGRTRAKAVAGAAGGAGRGRGKQPPVLEDSMCTRPAVASKRKANSSAEPMDEEHAISVVAPRPKAKAKAKAKAEATDRKAEATAPDLAMPDTKDVEQGDDDLVVSPPRRRARTMATELAARGLTCEGRGQSCPIAKSEGEGKGKREGQGGCKTSRRTGRPLDPAGLAPRQ